MRIRLLQVLIGVACSIPAAYAEEGMAASLSPTKASYFQGEPIEMLLAVQNGTRVGVSLLADYPTFGAGARGITIHSVGDPTGKGQLGWPTSYNFWRIPEITLGPGETWTSKIYLQRFIGGLAPGTHELEYSIEVPYDIERRPEAVAKGAGRLTVIVLAGSDNDVGKALAGYAQVFDETTDYWRRREAEEALSVTESPLVIPYLARLLKTAFMAYPTAALAKFPGNPDAEKIVLSIIRGEGAGDPATVFWVLGEWRYRLSPADFRAVLAGPNTNVAMAALDYAVQVGERAYAPDIAARAAEANEPIATFARRALQGLGAAGQQP
jgi:hypothetical protein